MARNNNRERIVSYQKTWLMTNDSCPDCGESLIVHKDNFENERCSAGCGYKKKEMKK